MNDVKRRKPGQSSATDVRARVALIGVGAQAKYACEIFRLLGTEVAMIVDERDPPEAVWAASRKYRVFSQREFFDAPPRDVTHALVCYASPVEKERLMSRLAVAGIAFISAVHPTSVIASNAEIGAGVIINAGAVVQPFARVGRGVMIHANAIVEHDAIVEDFANLGPGAKLAGWVQIGRGAIVYTGASVIPKVRIGAGAVVAAGAAVISDVEPATLVGGVPADRKSVV